MIKNERQYRITKAQAEEFDRTLQSLHESPSLGMHPRIVEAQQDAVRSQLEELREELVAYEALQAGRTNILELTSIDQLPAALIQGRIAAGLTQKELADRLGMKEQQLQRYEATDYAGASLERIRQVISALGIRMREDVFLSGADVSLDNLRRRAATVGLSKDFIEKRIIVREKTIPNGDGDRVLQAAGILNRIFGWAPSVLFGNTSLVARSQALAGVRFKLPASAATAATETYATYAHYVASLLLRATPTLKKKRVPVDAAEVRDAIRGQGVELTFERTLDYVWSLGVPVLPLNDPGAFHGATWRIDGCNVIVLKQRTRHAARWCHDLLHELRHAAEDPDTDQLAFIDYEFLAKEQQSSVEETAASKFSGDVLLKGCAEELVKKCVAAAGGQIPRLKSVVPQVAAREGVSVEALANYLAFRLSLQGNNWWGTATNLQQPGPDPWRTARDVAMSHLNLATLDEVERSVLLRALEDEGVL